MAGQEVSSILLWVTTLLMGPVWHDRFVIILEFSDLFEGLQLPGEFFDSKLSLC